MCAVFEYLIKPKIYIAQERYEEKVTMGKTAGRKKVIDDMEIKELAKQGLKAKEIAVKLNVSIDAIYHSNGWKDRNL